jgi:hypothetical protein
MIPKSGTRFSEKIMLKRKNLSEHVGVGIFKKLKTAG